ncbi:MAG: heme-binding protein [Pseudomonadota bacterium]
MKSFVIFTIVVLLLTFVAVVPRIAFAVAEPAHTVKVKDGNIEIREYAPMIVAEVTVEGDMRTAGRRGFRPLADFIFGNNRPAQKIDMTAPVTRAASTKIKMTAPVTRVENDEETWTVAFVMPSEWTLETLPQPNNEDVTIREVAAELVATIQFSGRASEQDHQEHFTELAEWLHDNGYTMISKPRFGGYDHPAVLGPFRRNEVMVTVVKAS